MNLHLDNLKIQNAHEDNLSIPIRDLHTVIIDNYKSVFSVQLMNALTQANVNVVLCDVEHNPATLIIPQSGNKQHPKILRNQIDWSEEQKELVQQKIVQSKIKNQIELLVSEEMQMHAVESLKRFSAQVEPGDLGNREGLASKMYFRALFGADFKRFMDDPKNWALNYGYAILRSQLSKAIIAKGMSPALGIFHKGPTNHFNLTDDLIEPFRPIVDWYVYNHITDDTFFSKHKKMEIIELTTKKVYFNDERQTLFNAMNLYVDNFWKYMIGQTDTLKSPIIDFHEF